MFKCKYCGSEEFFAHQVCHHDIIVDGDENYIDDMNGPNGDSIYESGVPYGDFVCVTCGAEYSALAENAHCSEPQFPYGQFHYRNWAPIREENGEVEATAPDSPYSVVLIKRNGHYEISRICAAVGHPALTPEYACGVLCYISMDMPAGYGATLCDGEAKELANKLLSTAESIQAIEAYVEHVNKACCGPDGVLVRSLSETDMEQVRRMDAISPFCVAGMLDSDEYAWGVFLHNNLIGYCTLGGADDPCAGYQNKPGWTPEALTLSDVFVAPEFRKHGYGSYLIKETLNTGNSQNFPVFITLLDDDLASWYMKFGFAPCDNKGTMFKRNEKEDAE